MILDILLQHFYGQEFLGSQQINYEQIIHKGTVCSVRNVLGIKKIFTLG